LHTVHCEIRNPNSEILNKFKFSNDQNGFPPPDHIRGKLRGNDKDGGLILSEARSFVPLRMTVVEIAASAFGLLAMTLLSRRRSSDE